MSKEILLSLLEVSIKGKISYLETKCNTEVNDLTILDGYMKSINRCVTDCKIFTTKMIEKIGEKEEAEAKKKRDKEEAEAKKRKEKEEAAAKKKTEKEKAATAKTNTEPKQGKRLKPNKTETNLPNGVKNEKPKMTPQDTPKKVQNMISKTMPKSATAKNLKPTQSIKNMKDKDKGKSKEDKEKKQSNGVLPTQDKFFEEKVENKIEEINKLKEVKIDEMKETEIKKDNTNIKPVEEPIEDKKDEKSNEQQTNDKTSEGTKEKSVIKELINKANSNSKEKPIDIHEEKKPEAKPFEDKLQENKAKNTKKEIKAKDSKSIETKPKETKQKEEKTKDSKPKDDKIKEIKTKEEKSKDTKSQGTKVKEENAKDGKVKEEKTKESKPIEDKSKDSKQKDNKSKLKDLKSKEENHKDKKPNENLIQEIKTKEEQSKEQILKDDISKITIEKIDDSQKKENLEKTESLEPKQTETEPKIEEVIQNLPQFNSQIVNKEESKQKLNALNKQIPAGIASKTIKLIWGILSSFVNEKEQYVITTLNKELFLVCYLKSFIEKTTEEINKYKVKLEEVNKKYSQSDFTKQQPKFKLAKGATKAVTLLNQEIYFRLFTQPEVPNSDIILIYKIFFQLINQNTEIAHTQDEAILWKQISNIFKEKANGKLGDLIIELLTTIDLSNENLLKLNILCNNHLTKLTPIYYAKQCSTTGLFIFIVKEALEYGGILQDKKTSALRMKNNLVNWIEILNKKIEQAKQKMISNS